MQLHMRTSVFIQEVMAKNGVEALCVDESSSLFTGYIWVSYETNVGYVGIQQTGISFKLYI